jgi:tetratricopeptide (TPR) repeat protein
LEHARGRTREAMAYLFEAIKMAPYHVQTYKELSDIYRELNQMEKSFEFKMLAALLADNKTTAEEWDDIADMAESFNRLELAIACLAKGFITLILYLTKIYFSNLEFLIRNKEQCPLSYKYYINKL